MSETESRMLELRKNCITKRIKCDVEQGSFGFVKGSVQEEKKIIKEILAGDREQFRFLVSTHKDQVLSVILRQVGNYHIAEELSQETFIRAYKSLKTFRFNSSFGTWITRIAINQCSNYFSSRRYKEYRKTEALAASHEQSTGTGDGEFEKKQRLRLFQQALAALNPSLREIIVLCTLNEKSYKEVATILRVPIGTVRSRLNTARLELKKEMDERQDQWATQNEK